MISKSLELVLFARAQTIWAVTVKWTMDNRTVKLEFHKSIKVSFVDVRCTVINNFR